MTIAVHGLDLTSEWSYRRRTLGVYEIGATAALPGVDIAVTWFDIANRDIITDDPLDPNFLAPVGSLKSRGIKFDGSVRLTSVWQVVANYAWTHTRTDDTSFATDRVLNVPEHAATLFARGRFVDADGHGPSVSAGASYVGARAGAIDASGPVLPAYGKANAANDYAVSPRLSTRIGKRGKFGATRISRVLRCLYANTAVLPS